MGALGEQMFIGGCHRIRMALGEPDHARQDDPLPLQVVEECPPQASGRHGGEPVPIQQACAQLQPLVQDIAALGTGAEPVERAAQRVAFGRPQKGDACPEVLALTAGEHAQRAQGGPDEFGCVGDGNSSPAFAAAIVASPSVNCHTSRGRAPIAPARFRAQTGKYVL